MGQGSPQSSSQEGTARADSNSAYEIQRGLTRTTIAPRHRLRKSRELAYVRNFGRRISVPLLTAWRTDAASTYPRVAIIVALHKNSAVARNRLRRRLWHLVRAELRGNEVASSDFVISARSAAYTASFDELHQAVRKVFAA